MLKRFYLNGQTIGFRSQTQNHFTGYQHSLWKWKVKNQPKYRRRYICFGYINMADVIWWHAKALNTNLIQFLGILPNFFTSLIMPRSVIRIAESGILDFNVRNAGQRIRSPRLSWITFYGAKIRKFFPGCLNILCSNGQNSVNSCDNLLPKRCLLQRSAFSFDS